FVVLHLLPPPPILFPYTTLFRSDPRGARRVAHLRPFPLPGGDAAARDGLRSLAGMLAVSHVDAAIDTSIDPGLDRLITLARKPRDRKSTRLNSSHVKISYAVFCL